MSLMTSKKARQELDRLLIERDLASRIASDLPEFYARLRSIAMEGEDADSIKSILALFDRLLGKSRDPSEQPKQAITVNVFNPAGGDVSDYKISRYGKNLGDEDENSPYDADNARSQESIEADYTPKDKTPGVSSLPELPPTTQVEFDLASINTPPPSKNDV